MVPVAATPRAGGGRRRGALLMALGVLAIIVGIAGLPYLTRWALFGQELFSFADGHASAPENDLEVDTAAPEASAESSGGRGGGGVASTADVVSPERAAAVARLLARAGPNYCMGAPTPWLPMVTFQGPGGSGGGGGGGSDGDGGAGAGSRDGGGGGGGGSGGGGQEGREAGDVDGSTTGGGRRRQRIGGGDGGGGVEAEEGGAGGEAAAGAADDVDAGGEAGETGETDEGGAGRAGRAAGGGAGIEAVEGEQGVDEGADADAGSRASRRRLTASAAPAPDLEDGAMSAGPMRHSWAGAYTRSRQSST